MTTLAPYTAANREFFAKGCAPTVATWRQWVAGGVVKGKLIGGKPYIDLNHFAANDVLQAPPADNDNAVVVELLAG